MSTAHHPSYAGGPPAASTPGPAGPPVDLYPPLPFHELHRAGHLGAWRPLVGLLVCAVAFFGLSLVWMLVFVAGGLLLGQGAGETFSALTAFDDPGPLSLSYLLTSLALFIPLTWALTRWLHGLRPRWTTSVAPRMRWGYFAVCLGLALVALLVTVVMGALLPGLAETEQTPQFEGFSDATRDLLLVALLFTPLQAAGEEYLFRGYVTQAVGGLLGGRGTGPAGRRVTAAACVVVPALLFALAHGAQDAPVFIDRFAFGLLAGLLVVLTGGLEAAIAMHVLNNLLAFGVAISLGELGSALSPGESSWWMVPVTVVRTLVYLGLAVGVARLMGLRTVCDPAVLIASRGRVYGSHPVPHAAA
ncbi:CPBP family glutamic-type intramembrane protease [Nocardioides perillae]|uniref:CAAX prenyl protease 2/Lysostaphin resistance protein A-like domain-containing protein n=1 Tax=Nocardioides perillae TaxID=1119534 RepID=A0A7Y9RYU1_9ACTN|nr:hypothetical protein [Nocardioides perillae]